MNIEVKLDKYNFFFTDNDILITLLDVLQL